MLSLKWPDLGTVLALGAHSDDIEIGAGATLLRLVREHPGARVVWVVLGGSGTRGEEARASAARFLAGAGASEVLLQGFRDGHYPHHWAEIKAFFETLKRFQPDLILTHYGQDLHQDHRVVSELTWNTFRDHLVLEYEIPKYDGDLGRPNVFVHLTEAQAKAKVDTIVEMFPTQQEKHWFGEETFYAMLRLRGIESKSPSGHAEAFYCAKAVLG
jgi:LmbE family N-acetylglucosaminyl deacetylase